MFGTYLRRELAGRRKQTIIVAAGLGVAIALVIIVNSLSAGVRDAQAQALESVYGIGTDLTVTGATAEPGAGGGPAFEFQDGAGESTDGTTTLSQSRLMADRMRGTLDASTLSTVEGLDGVSAASGALSLTNTTFSGEMPDMSQMGQPGEGGAPPAGGPDGAGGSAFDIQSFTVLGIDPSAVSVGPLSAVTLQDGRALDAQDVGQNVAIVDSAYATTNELAVGDTIDVGGTAMEVVGIVASTSNEADTAANVYLPLDVAQTLSGVGEVSCTIVPEAPVREQAA